MGTEPRARVNSPPLPSRSSRHRLRAIAGLLFLYLVLAYGLIPLGWRWHSSRHPVLDDAPRITHTKDGIPGDPLNLVLIGTENQLKKAMLAAHWHPADAITFESCLKISRATLLRRPYEDAPVSNLYVWGRKQDLAFQQPVGHDPRQRHHVRFWRWEEQDDQGRPLWIGAATFDRRVGLSHTTGQVTHHIAAAVDQERDHLIEDLTSAGQVVLLTWENHYQSKLKGRNGGGDIYFTDGNLPVLVLVDAE